MNRSRIQRHIQSLITILLVGCGAMTRVSVPVTRPAEVNLKEFDKIAVGEIQGSEGGVVSAIATGFQALQGRETRDQGSSKFTNELMSALFQSERFDVLEHQSLKMSLSQNNLVMSSLTGGGNEEKIKKIFGNLAFIYGNISVYDYDEELTHIDRKNEDKKTGKVTTTRTYSRTGTATVQASLRVVDLRTSKILANRTFRESERRRVWKNNSRPPAIDSAPLFKDCRARIIRSFMRMIVPYSEHVYVSFETDKEIPELDHGFRMVKAGDWEGATDVFQNLVETYSTSPLIHKAYYNLGLSYMYTDRFDEARTALKQAYSAKPERKYMEAISNLNKRIEDTRRLEAQRHVEPDADKSDGEPVENKSQPEDDKSKKAE